jgi:hypothetical protein
MKTEDISLIVIYLITMLCMVIYGVLGIIEKYKDYKTNGRNYKPDYTGEIMTILGGLTPGCILIGCFIIIIGFMTLIIEGPNWLLNKILK